MAGKKAPAKQPPAKDEHKEDVQLVPAVQVEEDTDTDGPLPLLPLALFLIPFTSFALALHGLNAAPLYNSLPLLRPLRWAGMLLQVCFLRREETRSLGSLFLLASATTVGALVVGRPAMRLSVHWLGDVEGAAATWLWLATNDMIQAVATVVISSKRSKTSPLSLFFSVLLAVTLWTGDWVWRQMFQWPSLSAITSDSERALLAVVVVYGVLSVLSAAPGKSKPGAEATKKPATVKRAVLINAALILVGGLYLAYGRPLLRDYVASDSLRVISSEQSASGRVVVMDLDHERGGTLRFIRADHSIIGGVWIRYRDGPQGRTTEWADSVFAAFPLQEVGLLAGPEDSGSAASAAVLRKLPEEDKERALVIGLGVGIGATFFTLRGLAVDVVEFDPAVYDAAIKYFPLGRVPPASVHLMDGANYVHDAAVARRKDPSLKKWSYIVQDCFSAGSLPVELFTREFWNNVQDIVTTDGVVVMNFAGKIDSPASRTVFRTILDVFPQCRAFGDEFTVQDGPGVVGNLVVVCSPSSDALLTFRPWKPEDTLGSPLRAQVYSSYLDKEVAIDSLLSDADQANPALVLRKGQRLDYWADARSSWSAIDKFLTPTMWMAY